MTVKRKGISKKVRFEIFKRDGFSCQYCGATPPKVILHVDHIVAVAEGGGNEMDNLVTACEPCNLGKGARALHVAPVSLADKAKQIQEAEAQLKGYQEIIAAKHERIRDEVYLIDELFHEFNPGYVMSESAKTSVMGFIEKIGYHEVERAMRIAYTKTTVNASQRFRYFCGICWNIARAE